MREEAHARHRLVIRVFGELAIEDGTRVLGHQELGGARPKQVLEILIAARGHRVPNERIADLLWGEQRPNDVAASIQTFVSVLRRHLVTDRDRARRLVVTEPEAYRFATDLVEFDLDRFDELVERSAREPTRVARRLLDEAIGLVRGEVLEDEPYAVWAQDLRGTYQGLVLAAHLDAADAALAEFDYTAALSHTEEASGLDRFGERAHRTTMLALYALGRQHEALDTYRRFRVRLDQELGLEPTAETRALESAILRQEDVRLLLPRPIEPPRIFGGRRSVRLLGRTSELDVLERAARLALDGSLSLLFIDGEAGVGKTRLMDELATSLVGVRLGRASGSELEQHLPYVPLAAALRDALGEIELDGPRRAALGQILPELSFEHVPQASCQLDALEALADVITEHSPLVLLLDDLQWADRETVAAISYLQRRCTGVPAVIVCATRSEEVPPDHPTRRLSADTVVRLEPLTRADLTPLGMPDLYESTGGNPRFVAEIVGNAGTGVHPSGLAEALMAQCRSEGAWPYRVLVSASVLEQPFEPEPLAALLRVDTAELAEELDRLCERRILRVDGFGFRFRYDLVREVLLASLSPARRRLLQERLAYPGRELDTVADTRPLRSLRG